MKIYIFSFFAIYRPGYHSYYNSEGTFIEKKNIFMYVSCIYHYRCNQYIFNYERQNFINCFWKIADWTPEGAISVSQICSKP